MPDIEWLLSNWGNWARPRPYYGHCFSIESRYNSPQVWYPEQPRVVVDTLSALEVERTMRHVPELHRLALKLVYVERLPSRAARRAVRVTHNLFDQFMADARRMVVNLMARDLTSRRATRNMTAPSDSPNSLRVPHGTPCVAEEG